MAKSDLKKVYETIIRPAIEYSSVVYHTLIPQYQSDRLEAIQKQALRIIYGQGMDYEEMVMEGTVDLLSDRREKKIEEFALSLIHI